MGLQTEIANILALATLHLSNAKQISVTKATAQILAKMREVVEGAELRLNCGGILSDIEVEYYNRGAEAQRQAILKAMED